MQLDAIDAARALQQAVALAGGSIRMISFSTWVVQSSNAKAQEADVHYNDTRPCASVS